MKFGLSPFFTRPAATEPSAEFSNKHARSWLFGTPSLAAIAMQVLLVILVHFLIRHLVYLVGWTLPRAAFAYDFQGLFLNHIFDWRVLAALAIAWHVRRGGDKTRRWEEWRVMPEFEFLIRKTIMHAACVFGVLGTIWMRVFEPTIGPFGFAWRQAPNDAYFLQFAASLLAKGAFGGWRSPPVGSPDAGFFVTLEVTMHAVYAMGSVFLIYILATLLISTRRPFRAALVFWILSWLADTVFIPRFLHVLIESMAGIPHTTWRISFPLLYDPPRGWDRWDAFMFYDLARILSAVKFLLFLPLCRYLWWKFAQREADV